MSAIKILSYFSLPTDLAGMFSGWAEFINGTGYDVDLKSKDTNENIIIRFNKNTDDDGWDYVSVVANVEGDLFERVLGKVVSELSRHSDDITIDRIDQDSV